MSWFTCRHCGHEHDDPAELVAVLKTISDHLGDLARKVDLMAGELEALTKIAADVQAGEATLEIGVTAIINTLDAVVAALNKAIAGQDMTAVVAATASLGVTRDHLATIGQAITDAEARDTLPGAVAPPSPPVAKP